MYKATVIIKLKKGVLNPEGRTIKRALNFLGFDNVKEVQTYKMIDIIMEGESEEKVKEKVEEMCKKLLANPVIHDYEIKIEKVD
ncbi:phosphoribosylformylglycinamidine synthase subunit PurS [Methanocaldococcus fervens]|uniref:Phosphoribosylformylglycinamidine synthase subunit PurS n=1 Tax=Methanocaldococcus fervens (strain DSM 4213 / JCM 15782 / AG86) TaxID=573064 RepID=C7P7W4_METFA|nr:phosphoribosylformylglycinamidine synthase subunit PurS [Methanocaldococcus fervens]ACV24646.1 phosphoribosylformylglycinamidine synthase, purS [Methanocaldococcus fervens AG86]